VALSSGASGGGGFAKRPCQLGTGVAQLGENGSGSGKEVLETAMSNRVEEECDMRQPTTTSPPGRSPPQR